MNDPFVSALQKIDYYFNSDHNPGGRMSDESTDPGPVDVERENMEDANPGTPGTVGDAQAEELAAGDPGRDPDDPGPGDADIPPEAAAAAETDEPVEQPDDETGPEE